MKGTYFSLAELDCPRVHTRFGVAGFATVGPPRGLHATVYPMEPNSFERIASALLTFTSLLSFIVKGSVGRTRRSMAVATQAGWSRA
jgi:hypothetical protein